MPKQIKCPGCGNSIGLPANYVDQVLRCTCGKAIKVRKREHAGANDSSAALTAMAAASPDTCAICANAFSPDQLITDRGRSVCLGCFERVQLTSPTAIQPTGPSNRGGIISFSFPFWVGTAAAVIWITCVVYLRLNPPPKGTLAEPTPEFLRIETPAGTSTPPQTAAPRSNGPAAQRPTNAASDRRAGERKPNDDPFASPAPLIQAPPAAEATATATRPPAQDAAGESTPETTPRRSTPQPARTTPPAPPAPTARTPAPAVSSAAPATIVEPAPQIDALSPDGLLQRGNVALAAKEWDQAASLFRELSQMRPNAQDPYNNRAQIGLAAAAIGAGRPREGMAPLVRALRSSPTNPPPSLRINKTIVDLNSPGYPEVMQNDLPGLQPLLSSPDGAVNESILNLYGTALATLDKSPRTDRDGLDAHWEAYREAEQQLESRRPGERRWGIEWMSAATVAAHEAHEADIQQLVIAPLRVELERAQRRVDAANYLLGRLRGAGASTTLQDAQNAVQQAERDYDAAQARLDEAQKRLTPRTWITQWVPAAPEPVDD